MFVDELSLSPHTEVPWPGLLHHRSRSRVRVESVSMRTCQHSCPPLLHTLHTCPVSSLTSAWDHSPHSHISRPDTAADHLYNRIETSELMILWRAKSLKVSLKNKPFSDVSYSSKISLCCQWCQSKMIRLLYFEMFQFLDEFQRIYASWDNPSFMVNKRKENISCYFTVLHRMSQLILVQKI